jgi:hypothetical protein
MYNAICRLLELVFLDSIALKRYVTNLTQEQSLLYVDVLR